MSQVSPAIDTHLQATTDDLPRKVSRGFYSAGMRRFIRQKMNVFALALFAIIMVLTLGGNLINDQLLHVDPNKAQLFDTLKPSGWVGKGYNAYKDFKVTHWLGTDDVGRDTLGRLLVAGQVSLLVGFLTALITIVIGGVLGLLAGYYGKVVDDAVNAVVQLFLNVPTFFVLIILSVIFTPDPILLSFILGILSWPVVTRLVRGTVLSVRNRDYVDAARAIGAKDGRIIMRHILPNTMSVVLVSVDFVIATTILTESGLSALGFGVRPPTASWGNMLSAGVKYATQGYWPLVLAPGVMIFLTTLCIFLVADGLRDAFDPRIQE